MKPPIIIQQLLRRLSGRREPLNLSWIKYAVLYLFMAIIATTLILSAIDAVLNRDFDADKKCAAAYKSVDWSHELYDSKPNDNVGKKNATRCVNNVTHETKDFPK